MIQDAELRPPQGTRSGLWEGRDGLEVVWNELGAPARISLAH